MKHRPSQTTIYVYPASDSPLVLLVRRGPSKWWHFMLWDRDLSTVTPGSWFNGMIYPQRCDLSPSGEWMLMLAYRGTQKPHAWTALCRPPSVKALVFWPQETARFGGGFFDGRAPVLWLDMTEEQAAEVEVNEKHPFELAYAEEAHSLLFPDRLARNRWKPMRRKADAPPSWKKDSPNKEFTLEWHVDATDEELAALDLFDYDRFRFFVVDRADPERREEIESCEWADWNKRGRIVFSRGGSICHKPPFENRTRTVIDMTALDPPRKTAKPKPAEQAAAKK